MESASIYAALAAVQSELKAPKGQMNTFGGYRYRSCEDILEAVKPILKAHDLLLTLSDEPKVLEGWHYIEATAKLESLDALLNEIVRMANVSVQPDKWLDSWHYAVGLYVAHYVTLQLRTFAESSATPAQAAASGALVGVVKSATLGDSSVTYDTSALTAGTEDWGDLNATTYGQMLANRARFIGLAGSYVI